MTLHKRQLLELIFLVLGIVLFILHGVQKVHGLDARYKVILEKNPFDPDRGAGQKDEKGGDNVEAEEFAKKYAVYGVMIAQGKSKLAFIKPVSERRRREDQDEGLRKVTEGDLIDGWRVTSITSEGVYFSSGRKEIFLRVFGNTKNERSSSKPVGIATPKLRRQPPPRSTPSSITTGNSNRKGSRPDYLILPGGTKGNGKVKNPFLKALMDARRKQKGAAKQEHSR